MSRPPGVEIDAVVDASVQAHVGGVVERQFSTSELPRLTEAGIVEPTQIRVSARFSIVEGHVAVDGTLSGTVTMTCQRCLQPALIDVDDGFRLIVVEDESEAASDIGGYEPVACDPARFDMRWLAEEQALLAAPLVPKHTDDKCAIRPASGESQAAVSQRPFANLRNLLREQ